MALLEAQGLAKEYGKRRVVDGIDLQVNAGEIVGLLGPNGAGKTTSFRMIAGMVPPTGGRVSFAGKEVTDRPMFERARLGLGYLPQDGSVFRKLTVEQNLHAIIELMTVRRGKRFRPSARQRRQRVDELLEQFGLTKIRKSNAGACSGGERRRIEIARCLISDPLLILLDEPFTGSAPITVQDIQALIRKLRDDGIGVLITDHQVAETLKITDRSYLVSAGKMLVHGTPREIVANPDARRVYLGEGFHMDAPAGLPASAPPPPLANAFRTPPAGALRALLDNEDLYDWIGQLGTPQAEAAATKIRARGQAAVEPLCHALERGDAHVRAMAQRLLSGILREDIPFDPLGDDNTRRQQVACIREYLHQRRAA